MFSGTVEKALLEFFSSTTVSSAIIDTLAQAKGPMEIKEIHSVVREKSHLEIPLTAVESSLAILLSAGLVAGSKNSFELTELGKELLTKLGELRKTYC